MKHYEYSKRYIHYYVDSIPPLLEQAISTATFHKVADLGCGDGAILFALNTKGLDQHFQKIYAVDSSAERIKNARQISPKIKGFVSDACNIPQIRDGEIDLVIANQVIEHLLDENQFLGEVKRILGKNGLAYISTVYKKWYGWYFYRNRNNQWVLDPTHLREYDKESHLITKLENNNFQVIKNIKTLQWFPITDFVLKRLGYDQYIYQKIRLLSILRKIKIPILGYYNWELLCKIK